MLLEATEILEIICYCSIMSPKPTDSSRHAIVLEIFGNSIGHEAHMSRYSSLIIFQSQDFTESPACSR